MTKTKTKKNVKTATTKSATAKAASDKEKKIAILYHKQCLDGFTSAWIANLYFGSKAEYIPLVHQTPMPRNLAGKEVYMIDFCYNADAMEKIKNIASKVVVIDHHISQKEAMKISDEYLYDVKHSGSALAWQYFFGSSKVPKIVSYVEDMDIWKNKIKDSEPVLAVLNTVEFDFKKWSSFAKKMETAKTRTEIVKEGNAILKGENEMIRNIIQSAEPVKILGKNALAVNSPVLVSKIGNILATAADGLGIVWCVKSGKIKISIRAVGKADAQKIAVKFGGGGHVGAASFNIPYNDKPIKLPWGSAKFKYEL